jgi:cell fate (sporulation/competence/biofilm development) regulator YlbF (YheA/YmcA/DUF963 family)
VDAKAKAEIGDIVNDLNRIIKDMNNIANELQGFKGIGAEYCAQKLYRVCNHYRDTVNKLNRL